ncbi:MetQ/NlpA family ABC transporter substrate-binding protein [Chitinimonas sp. BJB300]|uniref:MetQ/NlpA family ABC transporter substrate-binding protein n=1 Tax=Chitinimonas sp. BJB300 TaxID=1559339 RepID=UPI000C0FC87B|nr:MetQ/NlpA family ABC transporter substrate-binding protein [Chitinimonas sp. BJB300]PHV12716.1 methionine ABC transporter substrate-binding protein [Chitinimonas sp. BJB300]TSJ90896.1 ABC transporter substrate-binding protein [Chitinimonas sp. BJB300]
MQRFKSLLIAAAGFAALSAQAEKLTVAATAVPHAEILAFIKPTLAKQGVELDVKVFTDYVQPNVQLAEKRVDANYFQTKPYLSEFNKNRGTSLLPGLAVHLEPFGAYSKKVKSITELQEGATIAIPNDPSNAGRAFILLAKHKVITLKNPTNILSTAKDVIGNPKKLKFKELEAATLPRVLDQVDIAMINANYALEAKLVPAKDALVIEDANSPYANYVVTRADNANTPVIKKLTAALSSPEVKKFITDKYKGAVVAAF